MSALSLPSFYRVRGQRRVKQIELATQREGQTERRGRRVEEKEKCGVRKLKAGLDGALSFQCISLVLHKSQSARVSSVRLFLLLLFFFFRLRNGEAFHRRNLHLITFSSILLSLLTRSLFPICSYRLPLSRELRPSKFSLVLHFALSRLQRCASRPSRALALLLLSLVFFSWPSPSSVHSRNSVKPAWICISRSTSAFPCLRSLPSLSLSKSLLFPSRLPLLPSSLERRASALSSRHGEEEEQEGEIGLVG